MAASRAPFGTDLQPKFNVRVVGGKIIHTPVVGDGIGSRQMGLPWESTRGLNKARPRDTSISGVIKTHKKVRESQGHVSMNAQKEGVSRPQSKRARTIDILPVLEEGASEALEEPSPLKVANRTFVQPPRIKSDGKLPSIVVQPPMSENDCPSAKNQNEGEEQGTLRVKELCSLVETVFRPVVNKLSALRDIRMTCNHADSANLGVLEKGTVVRVFSSHGAKISTKDLSKLCELIPCSMGAEHVLYDKLCTTAEQVLNNTYPNTGTNSPPNTLTPTGSVSSTSPDSVEDCDVGYGLPMLADRTNSIRHSLPLEKPLGLYGKPRGGRSLLTHPLSKTQSTSTATKLPQISESSLNGSTILSTAPPLGNRLEAEWPLSPGATKVEKEEGVEKMFNALRSCTDSQGLLESEHAQRVLQNYNVIYKLGLPANQIRDYFKINSRPCAEELSVQIVTEHFLKFLSNSCLHHHIH